MLRMLLIANGVIDASRIRVAFDGQ